MPTFEIVPVSTQGPGKPIVAGAAVRLGITDLSGAPATVVYNGASTSEILTDGSSSTVVFSHPTATRLRVTFTGYGTSRVIRSIDDGTGGTGADIDGGAL